MLSSEPVIVNTYTQRKICFALVSLLILNTFSIIPVFSWIERGASIFVMALKMIHSGFLNTLMCHNTLIRSHICTFICAHKTHIPFWQGGPRVFPRSELEADLKEAQSQTHTSNTHTPHIHHQSLSADRPIYSIGQNLYLYLYISLCCILPFISLFLVFPDIILSIYAHI